MNKKKEPIDVSIIHSFSVAVMTKMENTDKDQYDALVENIENETEVL